MKRVFLSIIVALMCVGVAIAAPAVVPPGPETATSPPVADIEKTQIDAFLIDPPSSKIDDWRKIMTLAEAKNYKNTDIMQKLVDSASEEMKIQMFNTLKWGLTDNRGYYIYKYKDQFKKWSGIDLQGFEKDEFYKVSIQKIENNLFLSTLFHLDTLAQRFSFSPLNPFILNFKEGGELITLNKLKIPHNIVNGYGTIDYYVSSAKIEIKNLGKIELTGITLEGNEKFSVIVTEKEITATKGVKTITVTKDLPQKFITVPKGSTIEFQGGKKFKVGNEFTFDVKEFKITTADGREVKKPLELKDAKAKADETPIVINFESNIWKLNHLISYKNNQFEVKGLGDDPPGIPQLVLNDKNNVAIHSHIQSITAVEEIKLDFDPEIGQKNQANFINLILENGETIKSTSTGYTVPANKEVKIMKGSRQEFGTVTTKKDSTLKTQENIGFSDVNGEYSFVTSDDAVYLNTVNGRIIYSYPNSDTITFDNGVKDGSFQGTIHNEQVSFKSLYPTDEVQLFDKQTRATISGGTFTAGDLELNGEGEYDFNAHAFTLITKSPGIPFVKKGKYQFSMSIPKEKISIKAVGPDSSLQKSAGAEINVLSLGGYAFHGRGATISDGTSTPPDSLAIDGVIIKHFDGKPFDPAADVEFTALTTPSYIGIIDAKPLFAELQNNKLVATFKALSFENSLFDAKLRSKNSEEKAKIDRQIEETEDSLRYSDSLGENIEELNQKLNELKVKRSTFLQTDAPDFQSAVGLRTTAKGDLVELEKRIKAEQDTLNAISIRSGDFKRKATPPKEIERQSKKIFALQQERNIRQNYLNTFDDFNNPVVDPTKFKKSSRYRPDGSGMVSKQDQSLKDLYATLKANENVKFSYLDFLQANGGRETVGKEAFVALPSKPVTRTQEQQYTKRMKELEKSNENIEKHLKLSKGKMWTDPYFKAVVDQNKKEIASLQSIVGKKPSPLTLKRKAKLRVDQSQQINGGALERIQNPPPASRTIPDYSQSFLKDKLSLIRKIYREESLSWALRQKYIHSVRDATPTDLQNIEVDLMKKYDVQS